MELPRKGKARRSGAFRFGKSRFGDLIMDDVVYVAPGMPEGVSRAELKALPAPLQMVVMEAWFCANFQPAERNIENKIIHPALEIAREFGGVAATAAQHSLIMNLIKKSKAWEDLPELESFALQRQSGVTTEISHPVDAVSEYLEHEIFRRLGAVEAALAKLQSPHGCIGHNNPPDGPLTSEEQASVRVATADIQEELLAARPDVSKVRRAVQGLVHVAATVGTWIWKRVEVAVDEVAKRAGLIAFGDAMTGWQALTAVIEAVGRWISLLSI